MSNTTDMNMTSHMISWREWRGMSRVQRAQIIDDIDDGVRPSGDLDMIALRLQTDADFDTIPEYRNVQRQHASSHGHHVASRQSVDSFGTMVQRGLSEMIDRQETLITAVHANTRHLIDGVVRTVHDDLHRLLVDHDRAIADMITANRTPQVRDRHADLHGWVSERDVVEMYDAETVRSLRYQLLHDRRAESSTFHRYLVQPVQPTISSYRDALTHVMNDHTNRIHTYTSPNITVNFHTIDQDGNTRVFSFNARMNISNMTDQFNKLLQEDPDVIGSDVYYFIRTHLSRVSINVATLMVGGARNVENPGSCYSRLLIQQKKDDYLCLPRCLRKLSNLWNDTKNKGTPTHVLYLRIYPNHDPNDLKGVPLRDLRRWARVCPPVAFVVMMDEPPSFRFTDASVDIDTYGSLSRSYTITLRGIVDVSDGRTVDVTIAHDQWDARVRVWKQHAQIRVDDTWKSAVVFWNDHYDIVKQITLPMFCVRCGSREHNVSMLHHSRHRLDCLLRLQQECHFRNEQIDPLINGDMHVYYDVETYPSPSGAHVVYTVCFFVVNNANHVVEKGSYVGITCIEQMYHHLRETYTTSTKVMIAFNGSGFDHYFWMKELIRQGVKFSSDNSTIYRNKILSLKGHGFTTWDPYCFVSCSLNDACRAYKIDDQKDEVDHALIKEIFERHNYDHARAMLDPAFLQQRVHEYCMKDVSLLHQLTHTIVTEFLCLTDINPLCYPTLSSYAYAHMQSLLKKDRITIEKTSIEYDEVWDLAAGGRTQVFQRGCHRSVVDDDDGVNGLVLVDVNSLYPSIFERYEMPIGGLRVVDHPLGEERTVHELYHDLDPDRTMIGDLFDLDDDIATHNYTYKVVCRVDQTLLKVKLFCRKHDAERAENDWTADIVDDVLVEGEVYEYMQQDARFVVTPKRWYIWNRSRKIDHAIQIYKRHRFAAKASGNKVQEMIAKMMSNAVIGKHVEKNHDDVWRIGNMDSDKDEFLRKHGTTEVTFETIDGVHDRVMMRATLPPKPMTKKPRHIGVRVYGLSQFELWRVMDAIPTEHLYYTDTDSLLISDASLHHVPIDDLTYGMYKVEFRATRAYVVSPKSYCLVNERWTDGDHPKGKEKFRLKGYHVGDRWRAVDVDNDIVAEGDSLCTDLYECLLEPDVSVSVVTRKMDKRFVRRSEHGHAPDQAGARMCEMLVITECEIEKALS